MKIILSFIICNFCIISYSQVEQIVFINDSAISVNLLKVENGNIEYIDIGKQQTKIINVEKVKYIRFNSTLDQVSKTDISLVKWTDVVLVFSNNETKGLTMVSEISSSKGKYYGAKNKLKFEAQKAIKKKALALGGSVVLVVNEQFLRTPINTYKIEGILYK